WEARDLLTKVKNIKAAVLMAHAFNDWNVVPEHRVRIYEALKGRVPLMAYYHQGEHGGNPPMEMMNKWFTKYLYGVDNGVEKGPKAWIVREGSMGSTGSAAPPQPGRGRGAMPAPTAYADYPNPNASAVTLHLESGGESIGGLALTAPAKQGSARIEKLIDDVKFGGADLVKL